MQGFIELERGTRRVDSGKAVELGPLPRAGRDGEPRVHEPATGQRREQYRRALDTRSQVLDRRLAQLGSREIVVGHGSMPCPFTDGLRLPSRCDFRREEGAPRGVRLTNLDEPLFDGAEATKRDVIDYLEAIGEQLLGELRDRPLSVIRALRGQTPFMQNNVPKYAPPWLRTVKIWAESSKREVAYALCNDRATLRWFANQRAVEYHPTRVRLDPPDHPQTHLVLDIDPPPAPRSSPPAAAHTRCGGSPDRSHAHSGRAQKLAHLVLERLLQDQPRAQPTDPLHRIDLAVNAGQHIIELAAKPIARGYSRHAGVPPSASTRQVKSGGYARPPFTRIPGRHLNASVPRDLW